MDSFDCIVLGGGHAGIEAAWAAHQLCERVAIVTMPGVGLGSAPCNPAVGGVGKGQVVREIDAMGGIMGLLADRSGLQYRILNESKGFAVQSTRIQIDKEKYSQEAEALIEKSNITVIRDRVSKVTHGEGGYKLSGDSGVYCCSKLIVTTGTFLNGRLHVGEDQKMGGRVGAQESVGMGELFQNIDTLKKRFKTGTPPRIKGSSIDFSKMEPQPSDERAVNFHFKHEPAKRFISQENCWLTRTNDETLAIIRKNKEKSPIFNGQIQGVGPRYCPSIEDKAFRYEDRNVHHVFVEPEGIDISTFYPNGISTSLPKEIQEDFLRTIEGLESAEIEVFGYAVEYDVVNTLKLSCTLEHKEFPGLYFAGQVCGTSGYEEAAGQGLMAGLNAGLAHKGNEPLVLNRDNSYIGVLVEDLVTNERDEPYRLFTARSENRLYIREDNTILRMSPYREKLGLALAVDHYNQFFLGQFRELYDICENVEIKEGSAFERLLVEQGFGSVKNKVSLKEVLQRSQVNPVDALNYFLKESGLFFDPRVIRCVAISVKYEGYIKRESFENEKQLRLANKKLKWEDLLNNKNISFECKQRISRIQPTTFGQLKRIEGIRPATLAFVASGL